MGGKEYGESRDVDAIIIGNGLGGLTAGAYPAKQGVRVLLFEQHRQPGGYSLPSSTRATSFGGIQGCEDAGMLLNLFKHLGLEQRIHFSRSRYAMCMGDFSAP